MKALRYSSFLLIVLVAACDPQYQVVNNSANQISISDSLSTEQNELSGIIAPYKSELEKSMNEIIGHSAMTMEKSRPEGLLGNFFSDLLMDYSGEHYESLDGHPIDFALFNHGGLRNILPAGEITRQDIFEIMPFENELVIIHLIGSDLSQIWDYLKISGGEPVSGLRIVYSGEELREVTINDLPVNPGRTYKVLTSDYLSKGGDRMNFFLAPPRQKMEKLGIKIRDAMLLYVKQAHERKDTLTSSLDGRIRFIQ